MSKFEDFEVILEPEVALAVWQLLEEHLYQGGNLVDNKLVDLAITRFMEAGFNV